jgi:CRISPR-associated protein Cmr6
MPPIIVPLPKGVRELAGECTHPGLKLDKFAASWDESGVTQGLSERVQRPVIEQVVRLSASPPPGLPFGDLVSRWEGLTAGGAAFVGTTAGPLTLHLARASALENAGICLHPIYGFTYLPGSGLKGLARAFAETVWLPALATESERLAGWERIEAVFGWAPGANELKDESGKRGPKPWMPAGAEEYRAEQKDATGEVVRKARPASAGAVVFHDAWPRQWPRLVTDILNSHHAEYYSKANEPPGDWEDPVPVYFLSVPPGIPFRFALTKRRDDVAQADLDLAADWLAGGLTVLGCGAKTATGYGHFTVDRPPPGAAPQDATRVWGEVAEKAGRKVFRATLELVTPAFLAGAINTPAYEGDARPRAGCDLRPATLRGQLRWWWRTLHAGFVDVPTLKRMEAAVWGDTKQGGAVRLTVSAGRKVEPRLYAHPTQKRDDPPSGTRYAAYGMDENVRVDGQRVRKQRFVMDPGATWELRLLARSSSSGPSGDEVLRQAVAALWLLTQYGGVGSKARKGFGSLQAGPEAADLWPTSLEECIAGGAAFRRSCGVPSRPQFEPALADPGGLADPDLQVVQIVVGRLNPWQLVDRVGAAYSAVAAAFKHDERKAAFGLPRRIHGPLNDPLPHQRAGTHQPPWSLSSPIWPRGTRPDKGRHASPIHLHVGKEVNGGLVIRLLAMPAQHLRNRAESVDMLGQFARGFQVEFAALASSSGGPAAPLPAVPTVGQRVKATIVPPKTRGGRVRATFGGLTGEIEGVPAGRRLEGEVELVVEGIGVRGQQIVFRLPT